MENYKKVLMRYLYRQEWRKKYVTLNEVCNMTRKGKLPSGGWRPAYYGVASISVSALIVFWLKTALFGSKPKAASNEAILRASRKSRL